jgi:hypothetical protein
MTVFLGRRAFDKRSWIMLAKTAFACVSVVALDFWLRDMGWGPKRLWVEAGLYCVLVFGTGAIRVKEMVEFVRSAIQRRNHAI